MILRQVPVVLENGVTAHCVMPRHKIVRKIGHPHHIYVIMRHRKLPPPAWATSGKWLCLDLSRQQHDGGFFFSYQHLRRHVNRHVLILTLKFQSKNLQTFAETDIVYTM